MPRLALLLTLLLCACSTPLPSDPYFQQAGNAALIERTEEAVMARATALPITESAANEQYRQGQTATYQPASLTSTAVANLAAVATLEAGKAQSTRDALAYQTAITATVEALTRLQSDTQKKIAQNNAAIANATNGANFLRDVLTWGGGILIVSFGVCLVWLVAQFGMFAVTYRKERERQLRRNITMGFYRESVRAIQSYTPHAPANLNRESKIRAMLKTYTKSCAELERGGLDQPFSRPNALTYGLITRPDNGEVWQEGHKRTIAALESIGIVGRGGKGGKVALLMDVESALVKIDTAPLPKFDDPIPSAKIIVAGWQLAQVDAG